MNKYIFYALLIGSATSASADSIPLEGSANVAFNNLSPLEVSARESLPILKQASMCFENPALMPFLKSYSVGNIRVEYHRDRESESHNPMKGRGSGYGSLVAEAYIKHKSASIWGDASYRNGAIFDLQWNESADFERSYPYMVADAIGGNLNMERYAFSGGYSNFNGHWTWGCEGGYNAVLSFRKVDPRPKTLTGDLHLRAGLGYNIANNYILAAAAFFNKYRQSTNISFVSELGQSKLYHLTGLGTHYVRFAGTGSSVYSDSYRLGGSMNIYPTSGTGAYASGEFWRETMHHVIVDLNRLPLGFIWQNKLRLQAGWRNVMNRQSWGAEASWQWHRRHGREGVFGDQSSGSFPQIGELEMYSDNFYDLSLSGFWQLSFHSWNIWTDAKVDFTHHRQDYMLPRRFNIANNCSFLLKAGGSYDFSNRVQLCLDIFGGRRFSSMTARQYSFSDTNDAEIFALEHATLRALEGESEPLTTLGVDTKLTFAVNSHFALGVQASYQWQRLSGFGPANSIDTAIFFQF